jgi:hypothetical protein
MLQRIAPDALPRCSACAAAYALEAKQTLGHLVTMPPQSSTATHVPIFPCRFGLRHMPRPYFFKPHCGALQVAQAHGTLPPQQLQQPPERLFGPAARATLAAQWNGLVDDTLGRLAQELGKRGI